VDFYAIGISAKTAAMPTQYSLPVIHPPFELLKRSSGILHFIAASVILINGVHHFQIHHPAKIICYCQLFLAADIYLVVFFGAGFLADTPGFNCIFRLIELLTIMGIGILLTSDQHVLFGWVHFLLSAGYGFVLYREYRILHSEAVDIKPTGITIPNFLTDAEISWYNIKSVIPRYHSIFIETLHNRKIHFQLRTNLKIEELQQIDEFCRQHQKNG
jgi:hypothetical protein